MSATSKVKSTLVLMMACFLSSGCGSSPGDQIVGKWEAGQADAKVIAEFKKDGTATMTMFGKQVQGNYKMNDKNELEWTMNGTTMKCRARVTGSELEIEKDGNTVKYRKV
jgi:hypothetical protein